VVHVVLDGEQDGRPPLDLLTASSFDHLQRLRLGQIAPYLDAVGVALVERRQQLVARLEVLRGIAEVLTGDAAEEQVVRAIEARHASAVAQSQSAIRAWL